MTEGPVREAQRHDIEAMVEHGGKFFARSNMIGPFDPEYFREFIASNFDQGAFYFLVTDTGSAGMCVSPFFATGKPQVQVLWIFDEGGHGKALMRRMIEKSIEAGASGIGATTQTSMRGDIVAEMYRRMGFEITETLLVMNLEG